MVAVEQNNKPVIKKKRKSAKERKEARAGYALVAPAVILYMIMGFLTVVASITLAFFNWGGIGIENARFVGLRNFELFMFNGSPITTEYFWLSLWNNFKIGFWMVLVIIPVSLVLAFLIIRAGRGWTGVFRTAFFIPMVAAGVGVFFMWKGLLQADGVLNTLFRSLHMDFLVAKEGWFGDSRFALAGIIIVAIWGSIPGTMILYYAGILGIDNNLYEAASIDGAGKFRQLVSITWPMIKPISLVCIVNILNGSFQMFDNVFVLTGGGPNGQTMVTGVMVYNAAFSGTQSVGGLAQGMGVASAMGWTVFIVTFTISLISMRLMRTDY